MQGTDAKSDAVTLWLQAQGLMPQLEFFGNSQLVVGWRVKLTDFELVYRQQSDELIICDFVALSDAPASHRAVLAFIKLIHQLQRSVTSLRLVRGLFLHSLTLPALNSLRERLAAVLEAKGATWQEIDGEPWLTYPLAGAQVAACADV